MDGKLSIKVSFYKDIIGIISISGELTVFVEEFDLLCKEVLAYIKMGIYRFILDLCHLTYIDSSGVGVIIRLAAVASKHSSTICVICDQPQIKKILEISNVDKIVRFVSNVQEGISFYIATDRLGEKV